MCAIHLGEAAYGDKDLPLQQKVIYLDNHFDKGSRNIKYIKIELNKVNDLTTAYSG